MLEIREAECGKWKILTCSYTRPVPATPRPAAVPFWKEKEKCQSCIGRCMDKKAPASVQHCVIIWERRQGNTYRRRPATTKSTLKFRPPRLSFSTNRGYRFGKRYAR